MILAAGLGSRMRPLTHHMPKPLVKVFGTSMITRLISQLHQAGTHQFSINVGYLGQDIIHHVEAVPEFSSLTFNWYLEDPKQLLGTVRPIARALNDFKDHPFWLVSSDIVTNFNFTPPSMQHLAHLYCIETESNPDFNLTNQEISSTPPNVCFSGIGYFHPSFFHNVPDSPISLGKWVHLQLNKGPIQGALLASSLWSNVGDLATLKSLNKNPVDRPIDLRS